MYCSNCGAAEQTVKTYCRQCGTWIGTSPPEEIMSVMIVFNLLSALFAAAAAIVLSLTYFGQPGAKWSIYFAAIFCMMISVYQTVSFFFALNLRSRLKQGKQPSRELSAKNIRELPAANTTAFIRPQTVTENTTEVLERKL
jgi:hypothetical protein